MCTSYLETTVKFNNAFICFFFYSSWLTWRGTDHQLAWLVKNMILSPKGSWDTTDMPSSEFIVCYFWLVHLWADAIEKQNKILTCNCIAENCGYDWQWIMHNTQKLNECEPVSWMNFCVNRLGNRQTAQMLIVAEVQVSPLMAVLKYQSESRTEEAAEKCW